MSSILSSIAPMAVSLIPGLGPIAMAAIMGGLTAGRGMLSGQGPLTSLGQGAMAAGTQFGFDKLAGLMNAPSTSFGGGMHPPAVSSFPSPTSFGGGIRPPISSGMGGFSASQWPSLAGRMY